RTRLRITKSAKRKYTVEPKTLAIRRLPHALICQLDTNVIVCLVSCTFLAMTRSVRTVTNALIKATTAPSERERSAPTLTRAFTATAPMASLAIANRRSACPITSARRRRMQKLTVAP
ncbi:hypothetical protein PENTCL1PPCAC_15430, partial [Pristionchus entomophagus]